MESAGGSFATPQVTGKRKPGRKPKNQAKHLISQISSASAAVGDFLAQNEIHLLPSQSLSIESLLSSLQFSLPPSPSPSPSLSRSSDQSFFRRFVSSVSSDFDLRWFQNFRMFKPNFTHLVSLLSPSLVPSLPPSIPPDSAVAATLFRLAHGASYEAIARRFGLDSAAAACLAFYSVCKAVNDKLADLVDFGGDMDRILRGFEWFSLPNCCGVLGFGKFGVESESIGKNGSLLVQALVDSEGRFLDISAGWPAAMKPESVFTHTKLYSRIEKSKELLNGEQYNLEDGSSIPQYILGESCLPLLPWLLTPYSEGDSSNSAEREFNNAHRRAMALAKTAFIRVKARWKLLSKRWKEESAEFFPYVMVMGCLLHNFLIKCNEQVPEENVGWLTEEEELPVFKGEAHQRGLEVRDEVAKHLSSVSMRR